MKILNTVFRSHCPNRGDWWQNALLISGPERQFFGFIRTLCSTGKGGLMHNLTPLSIFNRAPPDSTSIKNFWNSSNFFSCLNHPHTALLHIASSKSPFDMSGWSLKNFWAKKRWDAKSVFSTNTLRSLTKTSWMTMTRHRNKKRPLERRVKLVK